MLVRASILVWILASIGARTLYMRSEPSVQVPIVIGFLVLTSIVLVILSNKLGVVPEPTPAEGMGRSGEVCAAE